MKKGTKLYGIIHLKCPRCQEGDLFTNKNPYQFRNFFSMPQRCTHCGQLFELETGFFYGAMYVSYALTIAISVTLWVAINFFTDISWILFWGIDVGFLLLIAPWMFKVSRAIWISFFVKYRPVTDKQEG